MISDFPLNTETIATAVFLWFPGHITYTIQEAKLSGPVLRKTCTYMAGGSKTRQRKKCGSTTDPKANGKWIVQK